MKMTIARKLWLGLGILIIIYLVTGLAVLGSIRRMDQYLSEITKVDEPTNAAAYEMEINAIGTGMGVLKYLDTADPKYRERVAKEEEDFEKFLAQYLQLTETQEGKELGAKVGVLYREFKTLGEEMMNKKDQQVVIRTTIAENLAKANEVIDEGLQARIDVGSRSGMEKMRVATEIEVDLAEVGAWLANYLLSPKIEYKEQVFHDVKELREWMARFKKLPLTPEERESAADLEKGLDEMFPLVHEVFSQNDYFQENTIKFIGLRTKIDDVLDEEIQVLTNQDLTAAKENAHQTVRKSYVAIFLLGLISLATGSIAIVTISKRIIRPIRELIEGAEGVGRGLLDHRIDIKTKDEIGELAATFNRMAEKLQEAREAQQKAYHEIEHQVEKRTVDLARANDQLTLDLVERKRIEGELKIKEELYRGLFESNPHPMWVYDLETLSFLAVNDAAIQHYGYSRMEFLGMTIKDIRPPGEIPALLENISKVTTGLDVTPGTWRHTKKDGTVIDVKISSYALTFAGRPAELVLANDITDSLRNQTLLAGQKRIFEMIATGEALPEILSVLARLIEELSDEALCSILLLDENGINLRHGAAPNLPDSYNRAIDGIAIGPSVGSCGAAAYLKQPVIVSNIAGDPLWANFKELALSHGLQACWSAPICNTKDEVLGTFALYYRAPRSPNPYDLKLVETSIHLAGIAIERKRAEEALKKARNELEIKVAERTRELEQANLYLKEADGVKSELIATVSHELRTPLTALLGFSELMLDYDLTEEKRTFFTKTIYAESMRLMALINDFLDVERFGSAQYHYNMAFFSLLDIIKTTEDVFQGQLGKHLLINDIPDSLPLVQGDPDRIRQVLSNLLSNALKFSPTGGKVKISASFNQAGKEVLVSVQDSGMGVAREHHDHLFQKFYRADAAGHREIGGTGLGLALCREIIEAHHGKIWFESEPGKGSTFYFTLPTQ